MSGLLRGAKCGPLERGGAGRQNLSFAHSLTRRHPPHPLLLLALLSQAAVRYLQFTRLIPDTSPHDPNWQHKNFQRELRERARAAFAGSEAGSGPPGMDRDRERERDREELLEVAKRLGRNLWPVPPGPSSPRARPPARPPSLPSASGSLRVAVLRCVRPLARACALL